jgi:hypothetical protein
VFLFSGLISTTLTNAEFVAGHTICRNCRHPYGGYSYKYSQAWITLAGAASVGSNVASICLPLPFYNDFVYTPRQHTIRRCFHWPELDDIPALGVS